MSALHGDKARHGRLRKAKLARRLARREARKIVPSAVVNEPVVKPAV